MGLTALYTPQQRVILRDREPPLEKALEDSDFEEMYKLSLEIREKYCTKEILPKLEPIDSDTDAEMTEVEDWSKMKPKGLRKSRTVCLDRLERLPKAPISTTAPAMDLGSRVELASKAISEPAPVSNSALKIGGVLTFPTVVSSTTASMKIPSRRSGPSKGRTAATMSSEAPNTSSSVATPAPATAFTKSQPQTFAPSASQASPPIEIQPFERHPSTVTPPKLAHPRPPRPKGNSPGGRLLDADLNERAEWRRIRERENRARRAREVREEKKARRAEAAAAAFTGVGSSSEPIVVN